MVTAVVVNWNGKHYLEQCLRSILDQAPPPAEVILADNHSTDGSREFVAERFPTVRIIDTGENLGPGRARNAGVEQATHDRVLLVDNDVVLQPGALASLTDVLDAHPDAGMVSARSLCHDQPDVVHYGGADLHFLGLLVLHDFFQPLSSATSPSGPVGGAAALCFLIEKARYLEVGGFHEELFFYFEDTDFAWRLRLAGHQLWLAPDAHVLHRGGTAGLSLRDGSPMPPARTYYHSRNRWAVLLTCLHWRSLIVLLPAQMLYSCVHFAFAIGQGHGLAFMRGKPALLSMLPQILRWRRAAQRQRRARDRDLLVAAPLTLNPGIADSGFKAAVRRALDRCYAAYWWIARPYCG